MPDNFKVSSDIDTLLRKQTKEEAATFLGLEDVSAVWGQVTGTLSNQTDLQGVLDENITAIALNTAKVGITPTQASDITANNAKVGITPTQASEITANTAKVSAEWGNITGTLTSQTDLQSALDTSSIAIFNHGVEILRNANNIATNTSNIAS